MGGGSAKQTTEALVDDLVDQVSALKGVCAGKEQELRKTPVGPTRQDVEDQAKAVTCAAEDVKAEEAALTTEYDDESTTAKNLVLALRSWREEAKLASSTICPRRPFLLVEVWCTVAPVNPREQSTEAPVDNSGMKFIGEQWLDYAGRCVQDSYSTAEDLQLVSRLCVSRDAANKPLPWWHHRSGEANLAARRKEDEDAPRWSVQFRAEFSEVDSFDEYHVNILSIGVEQEGVEHPPTAKVQVWRWGGEEGRWDVPLQDSCSTLSETPTVNPPKSDAPWHLVLESEATVIRHEKSYCAIFGETEMVLRCSHNLPAESVQWQERALHCEALEALQKKLEASVTAASAQSTSWSFDDMAEHQAKVARLRDEVERLHLEYATVPPNRMFFEDLLLRISGRGTPAGRGARLEFFVTSPVPDVRLVPSVTCTDSALRVMEVPDPGAGEPLAIHVELVHIPAEPPVACVTVDLSKGGRVLTHACRFPLPLVAFLRPMRPGLASAAWERAASMQHWPIPAHTVSLLLSLPTVRLERAISCDGALQKPSPSPHQAGEFSVLAGELVAGDILHICFVAVLLSGEFGCQLMVRSDDSRIAGAVREAASVKLEALASSAPEPVCSIVSLH